MSTTQLTKLDRWMVRRLMQRYGSFGMCNAIADELDTSVALYGQSSKSIYWKTTARILRNLFESVQAEMSE